MTIYALLVGINQYQSQEIKPLNGCHNDVLLFEKTLNNKFPIQDGNIKKLFSEDATRDNIIQEFENHLLAKSTKDDTAIFYFSGHGAQSLTHEAFWHIEPDHREESLVCHDSRVKDIPDLRDKDLRYLLNKLAQKCDHIVTILDSCHGGGGTRVLDESTDHVRLAPEDEQNHSLDSYLFYENSNKPTDIEGIQAIIPPLSKHILLAGCRDFQLSRERKQGIDYEYHGLFTYALCEALNSQQYALSYRELLTRIHTRVQRLQLSQSPQLEAIGGANALETVFGGDIHPLHLVASKSGRYWQVNAGNIHGYREGDEIAFFQQEVSSDLTQSIASARIRTADAFSSQLDILRNEQDLQNDDIYNAVVTRQNFPKTKVKVPVELHQNLAPLFDDHGDINSIGVFLEIDSDNPRYELHFSNDLYFVTDKDSSRPLFSKKRRPEAALEDLAVLSRWWEKLQLSNPDSRIPSDAVEMIVSYQGEEYHSEDVTLSYQYDEFNDEWIQPEFNLDLVLKDGFQGSLWCAILFFDGSTGQIIASPLLTTTLLTHNQSNWEGNANAVSKVPTYEGNPIRLKIPEELTDLGVTKVQDFLKLIVCKTEFDVSLLEQGGNELYRGEKNTRFILNTTLEQLMNSSHYRSMDQSTPKVASDWYSKNITLTLQRPQESLKVGAISFTELLVDNENDIRIEPHPSFGGRVRLINTNEENQKIERDRESSKSFISANAKNIPLIEIAPPPLSSTNNAFSFSSGLNADLGLDALEIFVNNDSLRHTDSSNAISDSQPLVLSITDSSDSVIPFTHDGQYFIPVGSSKSEGDITKIYINQLPDTARSFSPDSRSLGSAIRIYFRKLIYRDILRIDKSIQNLRIPKFSSENPEKVIGFLDDPEEIKSQVVEAKNILLVIHGLFGDTSTFAGVVNSEEVPALNHHYDCVLTFDYENLSTSIEKTAEALKEMLEKVGLTEAAEKKVDILAHSMGGLVARYFIEYLKGEEITNKLVMLGTPNNGTPYASLKEHGDTLLKTWAYSNLAAILNGFVGGFAGGLAIAGFIKLLEDTDQTLEQLVPDTSLLKSLYQSKQPKTKYYLIAGDTADMMIEDDEYGQSLGSLFKYLKERIKITAYDNLTDRLFKTPNDLAVSHSSMTHFNPNWKEQVTVTKIKTDHLSYTSNTEALKQLSLWLVE